RADGLGDHAAAPGRRHRPVDRGAVQPGADRRTWLACRRESHFGRGADVLAGFLLLRWRYTATPSWRPDCWLGLVERCGSGPIWLCRRVPRLEAVVSIAEVYDPPRATRPLVPPSPPRAPETMGPLGRMAAMRRSAISTWGQHAYEEDIVQGWFFGHASFILNTPDAIRHVLVDNYENYVRTPT